MKSTNLLSLCSGYSCTVIVQVTSRVAYTNARNHQTASRQCRILFILITNHRHLRIISRINTKRYGLRYSFIQLQNFIIKAKYQAVNRCS